MEFPAIQTPWVVTGRHVPLPRTGIVTHLHASQDPKKTRSLACMIAGGSRHGGGWSCAEQSASARGCA
eukprot:15448940-Alexandrium_andersonii.AAC.1